MRAGYNFVTGGALLAQGTAMEPANPPELVGVIVAHGACRWRRWVNPKKQVVC